MPDISKIVLPDNTEYEIKDAKARMIILSYGHSTWTDFISAYQNNQVIYCRASSNSNPATGSQTRLAFMAYVSNADTPTEVEFQYYRSMNKHTDAQQGDQVFVYKLTNANKWTVTVRNVFSKVIAGDNISSTFVESETTSSITLNAEYDTEVTEDSTKLITSGAVADALASKADTANLAHVATSGDYSDLINTPTIPVVDTQLNPNSNNAIANSVVAAVRDLIYPVGSIYMSVTDSTVASVEARFGGTWERISEGKALFGYSTTDTDFQTIGSGGGNKTVNLQHTHGFASNTVVGNTTLTAAQSGIPAHAHNVPTHGHSMTQPVFSVSGGAKSAGITGGSHHHTAGLTSAIYGKPYQQFGAAAVASGSNYTVPCRDGDRSWGGDTSSNTHTHDLPSHSHTVSRTTDAAVKDKSAFDTNNNTAKDATAAHNHSLSSVTTNSQLSTIQNVLNPYITVYMYKRTA